MSVTNAKIRTGHDTAAAPEDAADTGFYRDLPPVSDFDALLHLETYQPVPDTWYVMIADVVDSTGAIQAGHYQQVNTLGASCIIAVLNACDRETIPYVFGGDGATFCIPPLYRDAAMAALKGTAQVSETAYGLQLRTGYMTVAELNKAGHTLLLSKMQISDHAFQAAFAGSGITEAERWLKENSADYAIPDQIPARADFTGLQCRWDRIPSPRDETVSLLIESRCRTLTEQSRLYQQTLAKITEIYGERSQHHPLQTDRMQMTLSADKLRTETRLYSAGKSWLYKLGYGLKLRVIAVMGTLMMASGMVINGYNWGHYKADMIRHCDHRKFDNMLRMVLAGTPRQRQQLENWLKEQQQAGVLFYGISTSEAALLTCLVFQHGHDHFHFVDGADGGYALAALHLKQQKKAQNHPV